MQQAVGVGNQLGTDEGVVPLKERLCFRQFIEIVGASLDVVIRGHEKPCRCPQPGLGRSRLPAASRAAQCCRSAGAV